MEDQGGDVCVFGCMHVCMYVWCMGGYIQVLCVHVKGVSVCECAYTFVCVHVCVHMNCECVGV